MRRTRHISVGNAEVMHRERLRTLPLDSPRRHHASDRRTAQLNAVWSGVEPTTARRSCRRALELCTRDRECAAGSERRTRNLGALPTSSDGDQLRLESVQANTPIHADLAPAAIRGNTLVQPQTTGTIEADFAIASVRPDQIQAFRVKWTARTDGKDYTEFTPFVQRETAAVVPVYGYYYPYAPWDWPFYDPYFYPRARVVVVQPYPRHVVVQGHRH